MDVMTLFGPQKTSSRGGGAGGGSGRGFGRGVGGGGGFGGVGGGEAFFYLARQPAAYCGGS